MSDGMSDMREVERLEEIAEAENIRLTNALNKQVGGNHYAEMPIQPVIFIVANELGFLEGNIVKYVCRHHAKNGAEDIKKAIHYCELLLQTKYGANK
jgi:hypothetical protein